MSFDKMDIDKEFRKMVSKTYGNVKGAVSKALEEDIQMWITNQEKGSKIK